jgi:hypothetical protein
MYNLRAMNNFFDYFSSSNARFDSNKYDEKTVELTGWGAKSKFGPVSSSLKRVQITVFPLR